MRKKIIYIDMDGVLVDYENGNNESKGNKEFFKKMKPISNAIESVIELSKNYDCYILTTAPWSNNFALQEKKEWIEEHFGDLFFKKIIFSHNKGLLMGEYIIDDRIVNGVSDFQGEHIYFGSNNFPNWNSVLEYLN